MITVFDSRFLLRDLSAGLSIYGLKTYTSKFDDSAQKLIETASELTDLNFLDASQWSPDQSEDFLQFLIQLSIFDIRVFKGIILPNFNNTRWIDNILDLIFNSFVIDFLDLSKISPSFDINRFMMKAQFFDAIYHNQCYSKEFDLLLATPESLRHFDVNIYNSDMKIIKNILKQLCYRKNLLNISFNGISSSYELGKCIKFLNKDNSNIKNVVFHNIHSFDSILYKLEKYEGNLKLKKLRFSNVTMLRNELTYLFSFILKHPYLKNLEFINNEVTITENDCKKLIYLLAYLYKLQTVKLQSIVFNCSFTKEMHLVSNSITVLDLTSCHFCNKGLDNFLSKFKNLKELTLNKCFFVNKENFIPDKIENLEKINLANIGLTSQEINDIFRKLSNYPSLKYIDIRFNKIVDIIYYTKILKANVFQNLENLLISLNVIYFDVNLYSKWENLSNSLKLYKSLKYLTIDIPIIIKNFTPPAKFCHKSNLYTVNFQTFYSNYIQF